MTPTSPHTEKHFTAGDSVRDVVIGMSDGLTVPFALAAGLSGAITNTALIVTAGLAEIAAGSIAMGLGGYLAAKSDAEHYVSERRRGQLEVERMPEAERHEVQEIFESYGLTASEAAPLVEALSRRPDAWIEFMMRFELGLEPPDATRARNSALTIAASYIVGGMIPLAPYIVLDEAHRAFTVSSIVTLLALLGFGFVKGSFTGAHRFKSALQTAFIGGLAATAAYIIARLIS